MYGKYIVSSSRIGQKVRLKKQTSNYNHCNLFGLIELSDLIAIYV